MADNEIFNRLKRLFSTTTIVRNVGGKKLKVVDHDQIQSFINRRGVDRYNRVYQSSTGGYGSSYGRSEGAAAFQGARLQLFRDYDLMDCIAGTTKIPLPDGSSPTIRELVDTHGDTPFYVFSYDKESDSVKLGLATKVWSKGIRSTVKITFDNGNTLTVTPDHPIMMRDGEYKPAKDILQNDRVMPFYQKDFYKNGYRSIYNFSRGWQSEHRLIAEQFNRDLLPDEVVHHIDFDKTNNLPNNLMIMKDVEHRAYHARINNDYLWSPENRDSHIEKIRNGIASGKKHCWNGARKGKNNPFFGKLHTEEHKQKMSEIIAKWKAEHDTTGTKNPNYRHSITNDVVEKTAIEILMGTGNVTIKSVAATIGCDTSIIRNRTGNWRNFKKNILSRVNHKIVSVEISGKEEVFDMTVEKYHNFATENCFVHNCDPIIASVLDIYSDECVGADTLIPLMDGTARTIKELYDTNSSEFWVYSLDENGMFVPAMCNRVAYNGTKKMYKIILDDGTQIIASENHLWVTPDQKLTYTTELTNGTSLKVIPRKISSGKPSAKKSMSGYEMLYQNNVWEYTHRLVANNIAELIKQRDSLDKNDRIIHHSAFNKLNNSPDKLQWVDSEEHFKMHAIFNKELWADSTKTHVYKDKIHAAHKAYWTPELKKAVSDRQRSFMREHVRQLTQDERNVIYGNLGSDNGMYGAGDKLKGSKNGRYRHDVVRSVDMKSYLTAVLCGNTKKQLQEQFNVTQSQINEFNNILCKQYGVSNIKTLRNVIQTNASDITITDVRHHIDAVKSRGKNPTRNLKPFLETNNITNVELTRILNKNGYGSYTELATSNNHRVVSVEFIGEQDAYDLVNVGNSHIYAIQSNDGSMIFCHNSTVKDEFGKILSIKTDNHQVQEILHNLFYDIINIEFNLWPWVRNLSKYGDFFLYLDIDPEYGIINVIPLSVYETIRIEGEDPNNPFSVKFKIENDFLHLGKKEFENYEIAHFRLLSDTNFLPYGKSMIEGGRRVWKQLQLMEDAMLVHRITRAGDKRKFKVDIGNIPPHEVEAFMNRMVDKMKKAPLVDPKTGDYNLRFNIMNITEDIYLPVRGKDSGTDIETLPGLQWDSIEDIEYLRRKLLAAFKVPKSFIGYEEDLSGKATLAAQDVRFAKTIERIQRIVVSELTQIATRHLFVQGFVDAELVNFELALTNPSTLYEQEKINLWKERFALATQMSTSQPLLLSQDWIYKNVLELTEQEVEEQHKQIEEDMTRAAKQQAAMAPPPMPGEAPVDGGVPAEGGVPVDGAPVQSTGTAPETDIDAENEEQIDDVDKILQDLESLGGTFDGEDADELEEDVFKKKMGRPPEGYKRNTDKHPLGRDSLGHKEYKSVYKESHMLKELDMFVKRFKQNKETVYKNMIMDQVDPELEN